MSTFKFAVKASLGGAVRAANDALPKCTPGLPACDNLIIQCEGAWASKTVFMFPVLMGGFKYSVWRYSDLQTSYAGNRVSARLPIAYHAKVATIGFPNPTGWTTIGSCGYGEPARGATIGFDSTFSWDVPKWRLKSQTAPYSGYFDPPCRVTIFKKNVTEHVERIVRSTLGKATSKFDDALPSVTDVEAPAAAAWNLIQEPVPIASAGWLQLNPRDVYVSALKFDSDNVSFATAVSARPRISQGERPSTAKTPLPPLRESELDSVFRVRAEGRVPMPALAQTLVGRIAGRYRFRNDGTVPSVYQVNIVDAAMFGKGETVAFRLTTKGGVWPFEPFGLWGDLYLLGRLDYDLGADTLAVRGLHFTDATREATGAAGFPRLEKDLIAAIAPKLSFPLQHRIGDGVDQLNLALNGSIAPNVNAHADIRTIRPVAVRVESDVIRVVVDIEGSLEIDVSVPAVGFPAAPVAAQCPD